MCFILSDLKHYGNVTSNFLEILFEVKMNNEKITRREISLPTYKTIFFFTSLLLSNLITFVFVIHLKNN